MENIVGENFHDGFSRKSRKNLLQLISHCAELVSSVLITDHAGELYTGIYSEDLLV